MLEHVVFFRQASGCEGAGLLQQIKKPSRTVQPSQEFSEFQFLIMTSAEQRPNNPHITPIPITNTHLREHMHAYTNTCTHSNYPSTSIIADERRNVTGGKRRERMQSGERKTRRQRQTKRQPAWQRVASACPFNHCYLLFCLCRHVKGSLWRAYLSLAQFLDSLDQNTASFKHPGTASSSHFRVYSLHSQCYQVFTVVRD